MIRLRARLTARQALTMRIVPGSLSGARGRPVTPSLLPLRDEPITTADYADGAVFGDLRKVQRHQGTLQSHQFRIRWRFSMTSRQLRL